VNPLSGFGRSAARPPAQMPHRREARDALFKGGLPTASMMRSPVIVGDAHHDSAAKSWVALSLNLVIADSFARAACRRAGDRSQSALRPRAFAILHRCNAAPRPGGMHHYGLVLVPDVVH